MKKIIVYTDGGARGNPGPAGAGAFITDETGAMLKEVSSFLGHRTNNWAEYEAVALGLTEIKKMFGATTKTMTIEVRLDSELIARQLSNIYQIKEESLFPQYIKVHNLIVQHFPHLSFVHVPREKNKNADRLANDAMDRKR